METADHAWETCKENVMPIKKGRSAKGLSKVFDASAGAMTKPGADTEETMRKFEQGILKATEENDPVGVYIGYFKWIRETFPSDQSRAVTPIPRIPWSSQSLGQETKGLAAKPSGPRD